MANWDVFISYAREDRATVVRPLASRLRAMHVRVWLDRHEIAIGDSIHEKINEGLSRSRFGLAIFSPAYRKYWPKAELAAMVSLEAQKKQRILPIWHDVDKAFVAKHFPMFLDRRAANTIEGLKAVSVQVLRRLIQFQRKRIDRLLSRLRRAHSKALEDIEAADACAIKVEGGDWDNLKVEVQRLSIWVRVKSASAGWENLARHLHFGMMVDLYDILKNDWPSVSQDALEFSKTE